MSDHALMSGTVENVRGEAGGATGAVPWPIELEPAVVRARLEEARRHGRPRYPWPDLPPDAWRAGLREIERAVRLVLGGGSGALDPSDPRALGIAAFTSGMGPLLGYWLESGRLRAQEPLRALLLLHLSHGRERSRAQLAILERALDALRSSDIEPVVLKAAASLCFPDPGVRPGVDIDLVVPPAQFSTAERALSSHGYERVGRQRSPRKSDWRIPGTEPWPRSLELLHAGAQYGIDLHDSLTRDFFGVRRVTVEGDTEPANLVGTTVRVLAQPARLAFHALHASEGLDNLILIRLVEIVLMVRTDAGRSLDWDALIGALRKAGGLRFAWPAFHLAEQLAPGTIDAGALSALERAATPAMRRVVFGLRPADAQRLDVLTLPERFMACDSPLDYVRRLAHMLLPAPAGRSPARLAALYADRVRRLLRGTVELSRRPD